MNLRQISYFVTISECKSFLKASQVLHISQPTVSSQIRLLEEELDAVLFERRSSGVILTPEGEEFLIYARNIAENVQLARESLRMSRADAVGGVTVGIPGSLSPIVSIKLIAAVARELPNVKLKVVSGMTGYLLEAILHGHIDFGLVFDEVPLYGLDLECLLTEYLCLVGRTPRDFEHLVNVDNHVPLKRLAGLSLALPSMDHGLRRLIETHAQQAGVPLNIGVELDASELLLEIVASTSMFTVYSRAALQRRAFQNLLHSVRIVQPCIERKVFLAHMAGRPLTRVARSVDQHVRKILLEAAASDWWEVKRPASNHTSKGSPT